MRIREFRSELWLPVAAEELFPFFADARNLEAITPPWLNFKVITPNIVMGEGRSSIIGCVCAASRSAGEHESMSGNRRIVSSMNKSAGPIGNGFTSTRSSRATEAYLCAITYATLCYWIFSSTTGWFEKIFASRNRTLKELFAKPNAL